TLRQQVNAALAELRPIDPARVVAISNLLPKMTEDDLALALAEIKAGIVAGRPVAASTEGAKS
ncbi:MAG TPA: hypothetical protein VD838_08745, partial [Anaeromyxobacteraceae bacterium]|nr:hypothetical protein [Anaeromyxobacteraceae bacterium]